MSFSFYLVYRTLTWIAEHTGLSYVAINVIVYYVILPTIFLAMIDWRFRKPLTLVLYHGILAYLLVTTKDPGKLSEEVFAISVRFLSGFSLIGLNYDLASVLICLVFPVVLFWSLLYVSFPVTFQRYLPNFAKILSQMGNQKR